MANPGASEGRRANEGKSRREKCPSSGLATSFGASWPSFPHGIRFDLVTSRSVREKFLRFVSTTWPMLNKKFLLLISRDDKESTFQGYQGATDRNQWVLRLEEQCQFDQVIEVIVVV